MSRQYRRQRAALDFMRLHQLAASPVLDMLEGGQLRLVRTPGPGRRYCVVPGSLTIDEAVRSARAERALLADDGMFFEYDAQAKSWQQASDGNWFRVRIGWTSR